MLIKQVRFDEMSEHWDRNQGVSFWFLRNTETYINDLIRHRGYVYLNQIYEMLGIGWNPDEENPCIKNDCCLLKDGVRSYINFDTYFESDGSILINIFDYKQG